MLITYIKIQKKIFHFIINFNTFEHYWRTSKESNKNNCPKSCEGTGQLIQWYSNFREARNITTLSITNEWGDCPRHQTQTDAQRDNTSPFFIFTWCRNHPQDTTVMSIGPYGCFVSTTDGLPQPIENEV